MNLNQTIEHFAEYEGSQEIVKKFWENKNNIAIEYRDINIYRNNFDKLKEIVTNIFSRKEKELQKQYTKDNKGVVIYKDFDYTVWKVDSFLSAKELCNYNNTHNYWCISVNKDSWNTYYGQSDFLFIFKNEFKTEELKEDFPIRSDEVQELPKEIVPCNLNDKMAIQLVREENRYSHFVCWDARDKKVATPQSINKILTYLLKNKIIKSIIPSQEKTELFIESNKDKLIYVKKTDTWIWNGDLCAEDWMVINGKFILFDGYNFVVNGNFTCRNVELTTMKNLPKCDTLDVQYNQIEEIDFCPEVRTLIVANNPLKSLKNISNSVKVLLCDYTKLTSLKYAPKKLEKLYINDTSVNSFKYLKECEYISADWSKINSFKHLPKNCLYLKVRSCPIDSWKGINNKMCELSIERTQIKDWNNAPEIVNNLVLCDCNFQSLIGSPKCKVINFDCNLISSFEGLQDCNEISCEYNFLENLNHLPKSVTELRACNNNINSLKGLNDNMEKIFLKRNNIKSLKYLKQCQKVDLNENQITSLKYMPKNIKEIHLGYNNIKSLNGLKSCTEIYLDHNRIEKFDCAKNLDIYSMSLMHNKIKSLKGMPKGYSINLKNNPIEDITDRDKRECIQVSDKKMQEEINKRMINVEWKII